MTSRGHPAPPAEPQHPWDRQHGETEIAWHAFRAYKELDIQNRSMRRVNEILGKKPGYIRNLERWSSRHAWVNRAAEWDQHLARQADERAIQEEKEEQRKALERHRLMFETAAQALMVPIRELVERLARRDAAFVEELRGMPVARLADLSYRCARVLPLAVRGERVSRGLPDWQPAMDAEEEAKDVEFRIVLDQGPIPEPPREESAAPKPRAAEA